MSLTLNHNCVEKGCKGLKYGGLNLTCNYCLMPCFFDCIENDIVLLLSLLNFDFEKCDDVSKLDKIKDISTTIKSLFCDSVFVFVCPSCKQKDSYSDVVNNLNSKTKEIRAIKKTIKTSDSELLDLKNSLQAEKDNVISLTAKLDSISTNSISTSAISLSATDKTLDQQISDVKLQLQRIEDIVSSSSNLTGLTQSDHLLLPQINHNGKLNDNSAELFEIYVSKFKPETSCDDIKKIISNKLLLNEGVYNVLKLVPKNAKLRKLTFVSFKISTVNKLVFESIMDNRVWAPNQSAVRFEIRPKKNHNMKSKKNTNLINAKNGKKIGNKVDNKFQNKNKPINNNKNKYSNKNIENNNSHGVKNKNLNNGARFKNHNLNYISNNSNMPPAMFLPNIVNPIHQNHLVGNQNQNFWQQQSYHHPTLYHQKPMNYLNYQPNPIINGFPTNFMN